MQKDKASLRKKVSGLIKEIPAEKRKKYDKLILEKLLDIECYIKSNTLMAYCSMPDEIGLNDFLLRVLIDKKTLILPRINTSDFSITAHKVQNLQENLIENSMAISEPDKNLDEITEEELDLIIVPGKAFSIDGKRLGRGKGCYDKFLEKAQNATFVAACYDEQIFADIPTEDHDLNIDIIVTPSEVIHCKNS